MAQRIDSDGSNGQSVVIGTPLSMNGLGSPQDGLAPPPATKHDFSTVTLSRQDRPSKTRAAAPTDGRSGTESLSQESIVPTDAPRVPQSSPTRTMDRPGKGTRPASAHTQHTGILRSTSSSSKQHGRIHVAGDSTYAGGPTTLDTSLTPATSAVHEASAILLGQSNLSATSTSSSLAGRDTAEATSVSRAHRTRSEVASGFLGFFLGVILLLAALLVVYKLRKRKEKLRRERALDQPYKPNPLENQPNGHDKVKLYDERLGDFRVETRIPLAEAVEPTPKHATTREMPRLGKFKEELGPTVPPKAYTGGPISPRVLDLTEQWGANTQKALYEAGSPAQRHISFVERLSNRHDPLERDIYHAEDAYCAPPNRAARMQVMSDNPYGLRDLK